MVGIYTRYDVGDKVYYFQQNSQVPTAGTVAALRVIVNGKGTKEEYSIAGDPKWISELNLYSSLFALKEAWAEGLVDHAPEED